MHVAAVVALLGALAPAAALAIRAAQMSPLALGVNVGMLALSAALRAQINHLSTTIISRVIDARPCHTAATARIVPR